jgi:hypothetical protein
MRWYVRFISLWEIRTRESLVVTFATKSLTRQLATCNLQPAIICFSNYTHNKSLGSKVPFSGRHVINRTLLIAGLERVENKGPCYHSSTCLIFTSKADDCRLQVASWRVRDFPHTIWWTVFSTTFQRMKMSYPWTELLLGSGDCFPIWFQKLFFKVVWIFR